MIKNLDWVVDEDILYVDGEGTFDDRKEGEDETFPWSDQKDQIVSVVIGKGITAVGTWNFAGYPNLEEVVVQDGFHLFRHHAFYHCPKLANVVLPHGAELRFIYEKHNGLKKNNVKDVKFSMGTFLGTPFAKDTLGTYYVRDRILYTVLSEDEELVVPEKVEVIGQVAFEGLHPTKVTLPESVREYPDYPFLPKKSDK